MNVDHKNVGRLKHVLPHYLRTFKPITEGAIHQPSSTDQVGWLDSLSGIPFFKQTILQYEITGLVEEEANPSTQKQNIKVQNLSDSTSTNVKYK